MRVSCLCPQGVLTPMLMGKDGMQRAHSFLGAGAVSPEAVAEEVVRAMHEERAERCVRGNVRRCEAERSEDDHAENESRAQRQAPEHVYRGPASSM